MAFHKKESDCDYTEISENGYPKCKCGRVKIQAVTSKKDKKKKDPGSKSEKISKGWVPKNEAFNVRKDELYSSERYLVGQAKRKLRAEKIKGYQPKIKKAPIFRIRTMGEADE